MIVLIIVITEPTCLHASGKQKENENSEESNGQPAVEILEELIVKAIELSLSKKNSVTVFPTT